MELSDTSAAEHGSTGFVQSAEFQVPHPEKAHKGGEDACFISKDKTVLGVFDGTCIWTARTDLIMAVSLTRTRHYDCLLLPPLLVLTVLILCCYRRCRGLGRQWCRSARIRRQTVWRLPKGGRRHEDKRSRQNYASWLGISQTDYRQQVRAGEYLGPCNSLMKMRELMRDWWYLHPEHSSLTEYFTAPRALPCWRTILYIWPI